MRTIRVKLFIKGTHVLIDGGNIPRLPPFTPLLPLFQGMEKPPNWS
jgi:hypothetical protein